MARKWRFKPSLRSTMLGNAAYLAAMGDGTLPADLAASLERTLPNAPKKRAAPRQLEAPVITAISELLAVHPRVIWAARFNSGAASYEAASGRYTPVWFHKFLRSPQKMRMPDFFGLFKVYRLMYDDSMFNNCATEAGSAPIAIEAKAPGWTKPRDDREREQAAFLAMIRAAGGIGIFATSAQDVADALR